MPFLYKHGKQCGPQTPGIIANENDIECTDARMPANTISPNKYVFVFKMMEGSRLQNLCIEGPKTDTKEQFMVSLLDNINAQCTLTNPAQAQPLQGLVSGVLMEGNDTYITNCEIFGFPTYVIERRPAVFLGRGSAYIQNCYIHNCKSQGYGYGIYVGYRGDACSPYEEVYITNNTFAGNHYNTGKAKGKFNLVFDNNTFVSCN